MGIINPKYLSFENGEVYYTIFRPYVTDPSTGKVRWACWYGYTAFPIKLKLSEYLSQRAA